MASRTNLKVKVGKGKVILDIACRQYHNRSTFRYGFGYYSQSLLKKGFWDFFGPEFNHKVPVGKVLVNPEKNRRIMARQSQHKFKKRQKEFERKRKAEEKMARRQGKKDKKTETDAPGIPDQP